MEQKKAEIKNNHNKIIKKNAVSKNTDRKKRNDKRRKHNIQNKALIKNESNNLLSKEEFVPIKKNTTIKKKNLENNKNIEKEIKNKKSFKIVLIGVCLLIFLGIGLISINSYLNKQKEKKINSDREKVTLAIKEHFNKYVKVINDTKLYRLKDNQYIEYGTIYKDTEIVLNDLEIDYLTEYFYNESLDCYIKYQDVLPINELTIYSDRYKNYIVFNNNIVTNNNFTFFYGDKKVYSFNESMSLPIIINNYENRYYVEFNNRLLSIKKEDVKEIINSNNSSSKNAPKVTTLCYHRVYDTDEKCNDFYICKKKATFDKEMKYLKDNHYFTLTMQEMVWYLSRNIQVPRNSVTITLDDGHLIKSAISVLEKYKLNATSFIKTKSWSDLSSFKSDYLEVHSHTHNMHTAGICKIERASQQGGGILCLPEKDILNDLKTSREQLNGAIALAYPFYDYNTRAMNLVKQAGFKIAFIGSEGVLGRSWPGVNLYKVPRMTIWDTTTFDRFKGYVTN